MNLYIPEIGDEIKLTADWTFGLYNEVRNSTLMQATNDTRLITHSWNIAAFGAVPVTVPAESILKIDRIYIRKGCKGFSSITFFWKGKAIPAHIEYCSWDKTPIKISRQAVRFWAKLDDVNNIKFTKV